MIYCSSPIILRPPVREQTEGEINLFFAHLIRFLTREQIRKEKINLMPYARGIHSLAREQTSEEFLQKF